VVFGAVFTAGLTDVVDLVDLVDVFDLVAEVLALGDATATALVDEALTDLVAAIAGPPASRAAATIVAKNLFKLYTSLRSEVEPYDGYRIP